MLARGNMPTIYDAIFRTAMNNKLPEKLAELGAAERFPIAARMVTAQAGKAPAHEFGFDVILTGIATMNAAITHHYGPAGDSGNRGRLTMRTPKSGPFAG